LDVSLIDKLPDDLESLKRLLAAERMARIDAEAKAANAEAAAARALANVSSAEALITHLKLAIEKLRRELYGSHSERGRKLLDQMELELEDLEATAAEDEIAAEKATAKTGDAATLISAHTRRKPTRKPFPDHLPRERVIFLVRPAARVAAR
jgi:transposase